MAGAERIVFAFAALQEPGETGLLSQRFHPRVASGEELVRISLVTDIPDQLVAWRVEHRVQRDGEFDHPEAGTDMPTGAGADVDEAIPDLVRKRAELVARERFQIRRRGDFIENAHDVQ